MLKLRISSLIILALATACSQIPPHDGFDRGSPESLLDVSSEMVSVPVSISSDADELADWLSKDLPTRAEVHCSDGVGGCMMAQDMLEQFAVPYDITSDGQNTVVLVYERIVARDCDNRYVNNTVNPYHLHHRGFGCSMAANIVQMVSDKQQFVSPGLLDYMDGKKSGQVMDVYHTPPETPDISEEGVTEQMSGSQ